MTLAGLDQMFADYFMSHTAQEAIDILIDNRIRAAVIKDCGRRDGKIDTGRRGGLGHYGDQTLRKRHPRQFGFAPKVSETLGGMEGGPKAGTGYR